MAARQCRHWLALRQNKRVFVSGSEIMAPGIAVIMVVGTGAFVAAAWWLITSVAPRWIMTRTQGQVALHRNVVEAMNIAIPRAGNDSALQTRLIANRDWHLAALGSLAPAIAANLAGPTLAKAA
jgi:hypothetical protein